MTKPQPVIALASCSKDALAIAANTLAFGMPKNRFDIVHRPLLPNRMGFGDMKSVIACSFAAAQGLFEITERAGLSICVAQEFVSQKVGGRSGEIFTVGMVAICCKGGPLSAFYARDWIPENKIDEWEKAVREASEELDASAREPPDSLVFMAADTIGNALTERLVLSETFEFASIH